MPNPLTINDAVDLTNVAIQDVWIKGSEKESRLFEQYFNVETGVVDYTVIDSSISGLGYAGRIVENAAITAASPVQGFDRTYTQVQYGVILPFTKMVWFFGIKKRKIEEIVEEARSACSDLRELRCADRLDNSFSTTYAVNDISGNYTATITGGDALAFISAVHTREDGGTAWSNRVTDGTTVNMDFEYDALKAARRTAALQVGPTGKPLNVNLDTLVVSRGYSVHNRAEEILGAINKGWIPASADHDGPGVRSYKILALPWVTTNTLFWWMFDSSRKGPKYGFQYKESQGIKLEGPNVVFRTGEIQYKATTIFDLGHNDARGWVGSKNTNAA
jgi:hypothetical protein